LQGYNVYTPRRDFFRDSSRPHSDYKIDFSKLKEDDIWRLLAKRFDSDVNQVK
jgi:hypothetical protein